MFIKLWIYFKLSSASNHCCVHLPSNLPNVLFIECVKLTLLICAMQSFMWKLRHAIETSATKPTFLPIVSKQLLCIVKMLKTNSESKSSANNLVGIFLFVGHVVVSRIIAYIVQKFCHLFTVRWWCWRRWRQWCCAECRYACDRSFELSVPRCVLLALFWCVFFLLLLFFWISEDVCLIMVDFPSLFVCMPRFWGRGAFAKSESPFLCARLCENIWAR